ncbi:MAG: hypothetical protein AABX54_03700 [Nanoarchaeota archaeon]
MGRKTIKSGKILSLTLFTLVLILLSLSIFSAYQLLCLKKGEIIKFSECNPLMKNYYCNSNFYCSYCVFTGSNGKPCPAMINKCNALGLSCNSDNNNATLDKTPPKISMCSPINNSYSGATRQIIKCSADEVSTWYYRDFSDSKWTKLCDRTISCMKTVSFDEGPQHIVIKAVDRAGNEAQVERVFAVDSNKPKILKTYPKEGFSNGEFFVEFKEENPKTLKLFYGNKSKDVVLTECDIQKSKTICDVSAVVTEFDGKTMPYWFELTDIADSKAVSKKIYLKVDISAPEILNPTSFWTQGTGKNNKYIYFNINVKEPNLDSIEYNDNSGSWKTLCSSLKNGKCEKKVTFSKKGHHSVDIQLTDDAGNSVAKRIEFDV